MHSVKKVLSAGMLWLGIGLMVFVAIASTSCLGLRLRLINSSVQKPSNVALYFSVEDSQGGPVAGLVQEVVVTPTPITPHSGGLFVVAASALPRVGRKGWLFTEWCNDLYRNFGRRRAFHYGSRE